MKKPSLPEFDNFAFQPIPQTLTSLKPHGIAAEAVSAVVDHFLEATIAAAMIIAHADGAADRGERRRLVSLFRASPLLQSYSADDVVRGITGQILAFELDYQSALSRARAQIVTADLTNAQFQALINVCASVLEADGVRHPAEEHAFAAISSMRQWGHR